MLYIWNVHNIANQLYFSFLEKANGVAVLHQHHTVHPSMDKSG